MRKWTPIVVGVVGGGSILAGIVFLSARERPVNLSEVRQSGREQPRESLGRIEVTGPTLRGFDDSGRLLWEASGKSLLMDEVARQATITKVSCSFFRNEKPASSFEAGRFVAAVRGESKEVLLTDGVSGKSLLSGLCLRTRSLRWVRDTKRVYADGDFTVTKGRLRLSGKRLEADPGFQQVKVFEGTVTDERPIGAKR